MLTTIRGTPQLVVISWKEGIYKTVAGDPDERKEVTMTTYIFQECCDLIR